MEKRMSGLSLEFIIHPGETLKEVLEDRGMTQSELAIRTDVSETHISNIVNCQKPISVSFAKKLEYALGIDSSFWINLQANYEKELADFEEVSQISSEEFEILQNIKKVTKYAKDIGLLRPENQDSKLIIEWRKLLNISSLKSIPDISQAVAYRMSTAHNVNPYVSYTWLRVCEFIAKYQQLDQELNISRLKSSLNLIRKLTFEDEETINIKLKDYFAECGIKFAIVKHFAGAPVQGVIKKNHDDTLSLIMTLRYKFADVFWFTLFHEIGHIIYGDIKERLIDYEDTKNDIEDRADRFAADTLISREAYENFLAINDFSWQQIQQFSAEQDIPAYILIGRLQREEHLDYNMYSDMKVRYELDKIEKSHRIPDRASEHSAFC